MTSRKIKRNLNKELMFNKIMPSSLSSVTSEHNNTVNVERAALKSEYVKNDAYEEIESCTVGSFSADHYVWMQ